jgi:hypothetical protein
MESTTLICGGWFGLEGEQSVLPKEREERRGERTAKPVSVCKVQGPTQVGGKKSAANFLVLSGADRPPISEL